MLRRFRCSLLCSWSPPRAAGQVPLRPLSLQRWPRCQQRQLLPPSAAAGATVSISADGYFVGPNGLTLYTFDVDQPGVSNCAVGQCIDLATAHRDERRGDHGRRGPGRG